MANTNTIPNMLPAHGPIPCRKCFSSTEPVIDLGPWRIVNDPGAWGAARPRVLVLGFSKGFTQATASRSGRFEDIPFKGMRPRLSETLHALGVLKPGQDVSRRMVTAEDEIAFGSLVRCSLSRYNSKSQRHECTGTIMPAAFVEEAASIVHRCAQTYLAVLPSSVRLVVMLGTADLYVKRCRELIGSIYPSGLEVINDVSYRTGGVVWVHASHPSGLNGHHASWMTGSRSDKQGQKKVLALEAVAHALRK